MNKKNWKVTYSLWAIGCGQMSAWPKIVMSLTSYLSCDDIQQWAIQQCHSQAVSQDDMWWDCMTEKSSTLTGCVGHKMWCDKNACQWQRLYTATWLTRCFLRPWDETVWGRTVNSLTSYGSMRIPGRKKCAATHSLLVKRYDVMRLYGRNWSITHFLLAVEWDLMWQLRYKQLPCYAHPVGHEMIRLSCREDWCHSLPAWHYIWWEHQQKGLLYHSPQSVGKIIG